MRDLLLANTILTTKVVTISETSKYVESHGERLSSWLSVGIGSNLEESDAIPSA